MAELYRGRGARAVVIGLLSAAVVLGGCSKGDADPAAGRPTAGASAESQIPDAGEGRQAEPSESVAPADPRAFELFRRTVRAVGMSVVCMLEHPKSGGRPQGDTGYNNLEALAGPDGQDRTADDLPVVLQVNSIPGQGKSGGMDLFFEGYIRGGGNPEARAAAIIHPSQPISPLDTPTMRSAIAQPGAQPRKAGYSNAVTTFYTQVRQVGSGLMAAMPGMPEHPATAADVSAWSSETLATTALIARTGGMAECTPSLVPLDIAPPMEGGSNGSQPPEAILPPEARV